MALAAWRTATAGRRLQQRRRLHACVRLEAWRAQRCLRAWLRAVQAARLAAAQVLTLCTTLHISCACTMGFTASIAWEPRCKAQIQTSCACNMGSTVYVELELVWKAQVHASAMCQGFQL